MGKTSYDIAGRLSEGMGFDGPENFFPFIEISSLKLNH